MITRSAATWDRQISLCVPATPERSAQSAAVKVQQRFARAFDPIPNQPSHSPFGGYGLNSVWCVVSVAVASSPHLRQDLAPSKKGRRPDNHPNRCVRGWHHCLQQNLDVADDRPRIQQLLRIPVDPVQPPKYRGNHKAHRRLVPNPQAGRGSGTNHVWWVREKAHLRQRAQRRGRPSHHQ